MTQTNSRQLLAQDDTTIGQQQAPSAPAQGQTSSTNQATSFDSQATFEDRSHLSHDKHKHHSKEPQLYSRGQYPTIDNGRWEPDDIQEASEAHSGGRAAFDESLHQKSYEDAPMRPHYERQCARSLIFSGLGDATTHADITEAVRGGQLLDVFVKPQDRTATVSFVESADAQAFLDHVLRHDLYIKQKRVSTQYVALASQEQQSLMPRRSRFAGMIATSFCPTTLPTRLALVLLAILSFDDATHV